MNPRFLFIISSDPRTSARPAEAIRIAAGVGTWKKVDVDVYLRDAGVLVLSEFADELIDEDNFPRYLPIIGEFGRPILVQKNAPLFTEVGTPPLPFLEITDEQLAARAGESSDVARF